MPDYFLAMNPGDVDEDIEGIVQSSRLWTAYKMDNQKHEG